jgi:hypothetical protein
VGNQNSTLTNPMKNGIFPFATRPWHGPIRSSDKDIDGNRQRHRTEAAMNLTIAADVRESSANQTTSVPVNEQATSLE